MHEAGLARTVWTDERHDAARGNTEVTLAKSPASAIPLA